MVQDGAVVAGSGGAVVWGSPEKKLGTGWPRGMAGARRGRPAASGGRTEEEGGARRGRPAASGGRTEEEGGTESSEEEEVTAAQREEGRRGRTGTGD